MTGDIVLMVTTMPNSKVSSTLTLCVSRNVKGCGRHRATGRGPTGKNIELKTEHTDWKPRMTGDIVLMATTMPNSTVSSTLTVCVCVKKCQGPCVWRCCGRHRATGRGPTGKTSNWKQNILIDDWKPRMTGDIVLMATTMPNSKVSNTLTVCVCQEMSRALCLKMLWQTSCYWSRTYREKHRIENRTYSLMIESQERQATSC